MNRFLLLCSAVVLWATQAQAARVVDHGFEAAETGEFALVGGMSYETGIVHSGSRSMKEHFLGNHVQGGTFNDFSFAKIPSEIYYRFWTYMPSSFQTDVISSTKIIRFGEGCCYPGYWLMYYNGRKDIGISAEGIGNSSGVFSATTTINYFGGPAIPQSQWVCVEGQITNSSPGQANGILRVWINGAATPTINVTTVRSRASTPTPICSGCGSNTPTTGFNLARYYVQYGGPGDLYYDDIAVDTVRIGCTGTGPPPPPADTIAPTPPTGLTVD